MQNDLERKVSKIVFNMRHIKNKNPTLEELCRFTGRSETDIRVVLKKLNIDLSKQPKKY